MTKPRQKTGRGSDRVWMQDPQQYAGSVQMSRNCVLVVARISIVSVVRMGLGCFGHVAAFRL